MKYNIEEYVCPFCGLHHEYAVVEGTPVPRDLAESRITGMCPACQLGVFIGDDPTIDRLTRWSNREKCGWQITPERNPIDEVGVVEHRVYNACRHWKTRCDHDMCREYLEYLAKLCVLGIGLYKSLDAAYALSNEEERLMAWMSETRDWSSRMIPQCKV